MYTYRLSAKVPLSKQSAAQLAKAVSHITHSCSTATTHGFRLGCVSIQQQHSRHQFSSTSKTNLREYFPEPEKPPHIKKTELTWPHPLYDEAGMNSITVTHRPPRNFSDRFALWLVKVLRWGTDLATGYKHDVAEPKKASDENAVAKTKPYQMSERKWLIRFIFLESVAGVPGMVAGMVRHLHSIRRLRRDNGWISTLLEEAYNERMHLLTFLKIAEPGWFMKFMCLGAQGVFFNSLFISYIISPRTVHRFVGYLEQEAVMTYTLAIQDLDAGKLPRWQKLQAPDIAVEYWNMPEGKRSMRDLLLYIRADEAKHREVNHTLGNLDQKNDPNPFASTYIDPERPHPTKDLEYTKGQGWERDDAL